MLSKSNIQDRAFYKISEWPSTVNYFHKNPHLRCSNGSEYASGGIAEWSGKSLKDTVKILFLQ